MKYATLSSLPNLWGDMDTLTQRLFGRNQELEVRTILVDVVEKADHYRMEAELPGFNERDVEVQVKDQILTISTKVSVEPEDSEDKPKYLMRERRPVQFLRSFKLPKDSESTEIFAVFKNGILSLTIPRKKETQPHTIEIRTE